MDEIDVLIPQNTPLPFRSDEVFFLPNDPSGNKVELIVLQGDVPDPENPPLAENCTVITKKTIENLRPAGTGDD